MRLQVALEMEWSAWSDARAGIDAEVAEPLVRELFLSRKVALVKTNGELYGTVVVPFVTEEL